MIELLLIIFLVIVFFGMPVAFYGIFHILIVILIIVLLVRLVEGRI